MQNRLPEAEAVEVEGLPNLQEVLVELFFGQLVVSYGDFQMATGAIII